MNDNGTQHMLGKLIERTDNLIEDVKAIKVELATHAVRNEARICALELRNAETKGGTRMMMLFGGAAATVGGLIASVVDKVWHGQTGRGEAVQVARMFGYGKSLNRIEEKVDAMIRQLKVTDWRCRNVRMAVLGLEEKMAKVDEWNAKWDQMMDSVHALMALVKSLKEKIDPESKAAADEAMSDVAAGMAEVGEFVKANVVSGEQLKENWDRAIASVLLWEGGSAVRDGEPGGAVNRGISLAVYREDHPGATIADLLSMTDDEAKDIYWRRFGRVIDFDKLPAGLDVAMLHVAVMQGPTGARRLYNASNFHGRSPLEMAAEVLIRQMHNKMHQNSVGKYGPGWSDRAVAVYEIAKELAGETRPS